MAVTTHSVHSTGVRCNVPVNHLISGLAFFSQVFIGVSIDITFEGGTGVTAMGILPIKVVKV